MSKKYDLSKIKEVELDILKELKRICEKNDIDYFLDSGTALGAVRHKGFIPWDDDIDVGMKRADYDRFLEACKNDLKPEYFLQTRESDKNAPLNFAKLRKNKTTFLEWNKRNLDMHHGIYIDIFPYDKLPHEEDKKAEFLKKCTKLNTGFLLRTIPDRSDHPRKSLPWLLKAFAKRMIYYALRIMPVSSYYEKMQEEFTRYNYLPDEESEFFTPCFPKYVYKYETLYPTKKLLFEDDYFNAPNDVDTYLKTLYSDYMTLPPENERLGHRPVKVSFIKEHKKTK